MAADVLSIPTITRKEYRRLIASMPRICPTCKGDEVACETCRGARVVGPLPRFWGAITFTQRYKRMVGPRVPEDVCGHMHRTAAAARRCR